MKDVKVEITYLADPISYDHAAIEQAGWLVCTREGVKHAYPPRVVRRLTTELEAVHQ